MRRTFIGRKRISTSTFHQASSASEILLPGISECPSESAPSNGQPAKAGFSTLQANSRWPALGRRTNYDEDMVKKLEDVYEGGILRPVETLRLAEHKLVNLVILDHLDDDGEDLQFAPREEFESLADHQVTLETVRTALSKIPDSLEPDFLPERNEL